MTQLCTAVAIFLGSIVTTCNNTWWQLTARDIDRARTRCYNEYADTVIVNDSIYDCGECLEGGKE